MPAEKAFKGREEAAWQKKIRLIARLDVKNDHLVKGFNWKGLRKLGDPHDFAADYYRQGVDELLYMDIVASLYNATTCRLSCGAPRTTCSFPITVGGGLRSVDDVRKILQQGGRQGRPSTPRPSGPRPSSPRWPRRSAASAWCCASRRKRRGTAPAMRPIMTMDGNTRAWTPSNGQSAARALGAGEILLTSVDQEGLERGMDRPLIRECARPSACRHRFRGWRPGGTPQPRHRRARPPWPFPASSITKENSAAAQGRHSPDTG